MGSATRRNYAANQLCQVMRPDALIVWAQSALLTGQPAGAIAASINL